MKYVRPLFLAFIFFILSSPTFAQCFENVKFKVIQEQRAIEIQFAMDYEEVVVNLEDTGLIGNSSFEKTITLRNIVAGTKYVVFENLGTSKYLIQLVSGDCKWVIGGIEGIIIKGENEK